LIKDNWKIISHYMFIACGGPDGDLVEHDLAFGVLLAVVLPELFELKVSRPYNLSEMRSELFEARGPVFSIVLDMAHVLVGLTVISATSIMAADITRRKTLTKITGRVLADLLISIGAFIAVIVMTTSTTILFGLVAIAATMWRIRWKQIVTMLATWMF
jgi:hypothetical protein